MHNTQHNHDDKWRGALHVVAGPVAVFYGCVRIVTEVWTLCLS
jgi:hypothetical protein